MHIEGLVESAFEWTSLDGTVRAGVRGDGVGALVLARPGKRNAWNADMWRDWDTAVKHLAAKDTVRAVVLCAEGPTFTAGLDLEHLQSLFDDSTSGSGTTCPARQRLRLGQGIRAMQAAYSALEQQPWPVIAAVDGPCVGAGVDLVTACDMRYATKDAYFCVKEVDVGITADLGTLQRLPSIVGQGLAAEMALTARHVSGAEAAAIGLVARCFDTRAAMVAHAVQVAADIAAKSPLAVSGTKRILLHTRDCAGAGSSALGGGLDYVATYNSAVLLSEDISGIMEARASRTAPRFSKL